MFNETSYNTGLGELGDKKTAGIGIGGKVGSAVAVGAIGGPVGAAVGAAIGAVTGILSKIFGVHAARVQAEDAATGDWAASGPQNIEGVMAAFHSGQMSSSDALASLQSIMDQYRQNMASVSKYNGQFGVFPDPDAARPSNNCNAACGIYWDTMQQIKGYKAEIAGSGGGSFGSLFSGGGGIAGIPLPVLIIGGLLLFGKKL
jgi:hypothetical protein